jgi:hypothetical protein
MLPAQHRGQNNIVTAALSAILGKKPQNLVVVEVYSAKVISHNM